MQVQFTDDTIITHKAWCLILNPTKRSHKIISSVATACSPPLSSFWQFWDSISADERAVISKELLRVTGRKFGAGELGRTLDRIYAVRLGYIWRNRSEIDVRLVWHIIETRCNNTQKQMDITRMKAKTDLVLYEKMKEDWAKEEHKPCCVIGMCSTVLFGNLEI